MELFTNLDTIIIYYYYYNIIIPNLDPIDNATAPFTIVIHVYDSYIIATSVALSLYKNNTHVNLIIIVTYMFSTTDVVIIDQLQRFVWSMEARILGYA